MVFKFLTGWAIMGSTLANPGFNDGRATEKTGLTLSGIHINAKHSGLENSINIGAIGCNRFTQNRIHRIVQSADFKRRKMRRVG